MKKIISILLAVMMLAGTLAACSNKKSDNATAGGLVDNIFDDDAVANDPQRPTNATEAQESQATTQPTQGQQNQNNAQGAQAPATQPTQGQQTPATQPTEDQDSEATSPTTGNNSDSDDQPMTYEEWRNLTPAKQKEYQESFGTDEAGYTAFFKWYNEAYEAYRKANPPIEIGKDGTITLPST